MEAMGRRSTFGSRLLPCPISDWNDPTETGAVAISLERTRGFSGFRQVRMFEVEAVHGDDLHRAVFVSTGDWCALLTSEITRHAHSNGSV
jgi:hypothetical protein